MDAEAGGDVVGRERARQQRHERARGNAECDAEKHEPRRLNARQENGEHDERGDRHAEQQCGQPP
jgi:hypothetical protein